MSRSEQKQGTLHEHHQRHHPGSAYGLTEDEALDLGGQRLVVDYLVDGKSDAVCILANYSEQFSQTDEERELVVTTTLDQAAGRLPVCVTTSHFSARIAAQRSRRAQAQGAAMVMLMPPFFGATMKVDDDAVMEYFKRVADGLEIDIMIQDAPMSPTALSVPLLARLAREIPQMRYAKIEMPQTADKLRMLIAAAGDDLPGTFDGEEAITLIPGLDAGAQGTRAAAWCPISWGRLCQTSMRAIGTKPWRNGRTCCRSFTSRTVSAAYARPRC